MPGPDEAQSILISTPSAPALRHSSFKAGVQRTKGLSEVDQPSRPEPPSTHAQATCSVFLEMLTETRVWKLLFSY